MIIKCFLSGYEQSVGRLPFFANYRIDPSEVSSINSVSPFNPHPNDSRPQFQEGVMDRDHGSVAAVGPERAGDAARDEGPTGEQRHDAAAPLRNLHTQGREQ